MPQIKFRAKQRDGIVTVPEIKRHHCDMHAFRISRRFGKYANSDLFLGMIAGELKRSGIPKRIDLSEPLPPSVFVDTSGFLAEVTIVLGDN